MAKTIKHGGTWFYTDEDYDYSKEIQKAVDEGNFQKAAYLEKSRNAKIDYYGMPYDMTYDYQDYLPGAQNNKGGGESAVPSFEKGSNADKADRTLKRANAMNFRYNPQQDPLYKQIKNNYQKSVGDVIENTMGSYAGMTGGMPSSYAVSAAATAGNQHMQKADDMIPELYQLAYGKYADDKADLYKQYGIYQGLDEQEYQRGRDKLGDERYDREQQRAAEVADREWQRILDNDQWNRDIYAKEEEKEAGKEARSTADMQIANSLLMGIPPSDELIAASGSYAPGTTGEQILEAFLKDENKQNAAERVANAFMMGVPPEDEDLAILNYPEGTTGEAALAAYNRANAPKVVYSSSGQQSSDKNLENAYKMLDDIIEETKNDEDGDKSISDINIAPIVLRYNLTPEQEALLYMYLEGFVE